MVPENLRYTKEHEWALAEGGAVKVGITHYAQEQLGDIVYVELPQKGTEVRKTAACGVVESVKAVSEIYAPVSGTVLETNLETSQFPETVNRDPYGRGWLFTVKLSGPKEMDSLLSAAQYRELTGA